MKKRVLLIYPGELYAGKWGRLMEIKPHLVYVYSFLKEFADVTVLDLENELGRPQTESERTEFKKKGVRRILSLPADEVAISCWSSLNYLSSDFLARQIKAARPDIPIIVGGYHPTFVSQDFTYPQSPFDHVIGGEIRNISEVVHHSRWHGRRTYEVMPDFRAYPYFKSQKTVGIFLGSGCPFQCRFCMEYKRTWRSLPVEQAVETVLKIERDIKPRYIAVFDACFGLDPAWRRAFLQELLKIKPACYFWFETRVDLLSEEDIELLAGLNVKLDFGVDSFSTTMLKIMNKTRESGSYLQKFITLSRKCSELKILHDAFLIFNHPGETDQTYREFAHFFDNEASHGLGDGFLRIFFQRYAFFPGSYVFNHIADFKAAYGTEVAHPEWWKRPENHFLAARDIVPSRDASGKPFTVPLDEVSQRIKGFNRRSREKGLWEKLHAFNL